MAGPGWNGSGALILQHLRTLPTVPRSTPPSTKRPIRPAAASGAAAADPVALRIAWWAIALALLGAGLLIDPWAEASFDAPKRLAILLGVGIALPALLWRSAWPHPRHWPRAARWIAGLVLAGLLWVAIATIAADQPEQAWPALRRFVLFALLLPIGASTLLDGRRGRALFALFVGVVVLNAVLSLLQAAGVVLPIPISQIGGRFPTGALLGNEGYVALTCASMTAALAATWLARAPLRRPGWRVLPAVLLGVAAIAVNLQATSAIALAAALGWIAALRWRARWLLVAFATGIALMAATALVPPLREASWGRLGGGDVETYQRLTTYRLGAWAAAIDMVETRPLLGHGPGAFAARSQTHRYAAEIEHRARFVQPLGANFIYAHQEYLQLAAEAGLPALLLLLSAFVLLLAALVRQAARTDSPQAAPVIAMLVVAAVSALAWFPLQIPLVAAATLLAAGRGWRLLAGAPA